MNDLTESWKNGSLEQGYYYIKIADVIFIDFFNAITGKFQKYKEEYINEVVAHVPRCREEYIDEIAFVKED